MPLKRPVTLAQARRWPAAAKRRESFCARMGGMRELLTGERAARDPGSPINRSLAAWDCDKPEGLKREHVSKGVRMKITKAKVGAEARKPAAKNPATKMTPRQQVTRWSKDMGLRASSGDGWVSISDTRSDWSETFDDWSQAMEWARRAYDAKRDQGKPWPWETRKNPARETMLYVVHVADSQGKPAYDIAKFRKRADALKYARAYADANKVRVVLTSRAL